MRRSLVFAGMLALGLSSAGCAAVGLAIVGTALGVGAGTGTAYTLDGIAYRTFTASIEDTRQAALRTMRRMDMKVETDTKVAAADTRLESREIVAVAGDRKIYIELEKLTSRTTRMRVTAKQGWFWRDRATAGEIIAQTADAVDETPTLLQKGR
jgi:hypothetical protein